MAATLALGQTKEAVNAASVDVEAALEREEAGQIALMHTQDYREGVAAFLAKRPAEFTGHWTHAGRTQLLTPDPVLASRSRQGASGARHRRRASPPAGCVVKACGKTSPPPSWGWHSWPTSSTPWSARTGSEEAP